jgi:hypothetical protein
MSAVRGGAHALLVSTSIYFVDRREHLAALAAKYKLPAIYQNRVYATAGGLMSYGPSGLDALSPGRRFTPAASSRATSPATCRSCCRQGSNS